MNLLIDSLVTLRAGARPARGRDDSCTTLRCDHRLRVLFPSGAAADTYLADTPFDVVERPIALGPDNHVFRELEVETKPQMSWTAVYGGGRGLAVVSTGLLESAVRDQPERTLALTLFRSTRTTVFTNGEPNGQLLGDWTFRYWLVPLAGEPDLGEAEPAGTAGRGRSAQRAAPQRGSDAAPGCLRAATQRQHAGGWRQRSRHEHPLGRRCTRSAHVQPDGSGRRSAAAVWPGHATSLTCSRSTPKAIRWRQRRA